jgi:hypothetical protein
MGAQQQCVLAACFHTAAWRRLVEISSQYVRTQSCCSICAKRVAAPSQLFLLVGPIRLSSAQRSNTFPAVFGEDMCINHFSCIQTCNDTTVRALFSSPKTSTQAVAFVSCSNCVLFRSVTDAFSSVKCIILHQCTCLVEPFSGDMER